VIAHVQNGGALHSACQLERLSALIAACSYCARIDATPLAPFEADSFVERQATDVVGPDEREQFLVAFFLWLLIGLLRKGAGRFPDGARTGPRKCRSRPHVVRGKTERSQRKKPPG
jgi:hypothetical protein